MPEACAAGLVVPGSASKAAPRSWGRRGSRRLNYTAHGDAINLTARLEAANKEFGSAVCVGRAPPAAARRTKPSRARLADIARVRCARYGLQRWRTSAHRGQSSCNRGRSPHLGRRRRPARHHDIGPRRDRDAPYGPRPHVDAPLAHEDAKHPLLDRRRNSCRGGDQRIGRCQGETRLSAGGLIDECRPVQELDIGTDAATKRSIFSDAREPSLMRVTRPIRRSSRESSPSTPGRQSSTVSAGRRPRLAFRQETRCPWWSLRADVRLTTWR